MQLKKLIILAITALCIGQVVGQNRLSQSQPPFGDYPKIADSTAFISWVEQFLEPDFFELRSHDSEISYYKRLKINGSDTPIYIVEYKYTECCEADYPGKFQLIFTHDAHFIRAIDATGFKMLNVFPNQDPFLLAYFESSKGNGTHSLYKIERKKLVNVYEGSAEFSDDWVRTVDNHQDGAVFDPGELNVVVNDYNADGKNDIAFVGNMTSEDGTALIRPIKMIFLYNPASGRFRSKADYNKLYKLFGTESGYY